MNDNVKEYPKYQKYITVLYSIAIGIGFTRFQNLEFIHYFVFLLSIFISANDWYWFHEDYEFLRNKCMLTNANEDEKKKKKKKKNKWKISFFSSEKLLFIYFVLSILIVTSLSQVFYHFSDKELDNWLYALSAFNMLNCIWNTGLIGKTNHEFHAARNLCFAITAFLIANNYYSLKNYLVFIDFDFRVVVLVFMVVIIAIIFLIFDNRGIVGKKSKKL